MSKVFIYFIGLTVLLSFSLNLLYSELLSSKASNTQNLVEAAHSIFETEYELYKKGVVDEEVAKKTAIEQVKNLRYDNGNYFWINDMSATMVMHPIKPELNGQDLSNFEDPNGKKLFTEFVNVVNASTEGQVDYMWPAPGGGEPIKKISYVKGFEPWGYIVGSGVYIQDVNNTYWSAVSTKIISGIIALLLVGFLSLLISRSVTLPISSIVTSLRNIAAGDGDLTQRLPETGNDEITQLASAFNAFIDKVHTLVKQTSQTTDSVNSAVTESSNLASQIHQSITHQKEQTDSVVEAIEKMSNSSSDVFENASNAAQAANQADKSCQNAKEVVSEGVNSVKLLVTEVEKASSVINNLQTNVGDIVSVLEVIRGIAEQTNLLALNAAIEAARAGEQGRGFAVVADEVRTLASRTQDSTEEIQKMIEKLKQGSEEAVNVMESSKAVGEKTLEQSITAGDSLNEITTAVSSITGMNTEINNAAQEQSQIVELIKASISRISEEANATAESSSSSQRTAATLSDNAGNLKVLIQQFKV